MFRYRLFAFIFSCTTMLVACTPNYSYNTQSQINRNLAKETWLQEVNTNPAVWTKGANPWFLTGNASPVEQYAMTAPFDKAISVVKVRVPDFTKIQVDGPFEVQILGQQEHNSLSIIGPNELVRRIIVDVHNQTVDIHRADKSVVNMSNVTVRIGVKNLQSLVNLGKANIAGRSINSSKLIINSIGDGNIILAGPMNLTELKQTGLGSVTVIGAYTPDLKITVKGNGNVNVSGQVGVSNINHIGDGTVSVIGMDTDSLNINAAGKGTTSLTGYANLKNVSASGQSKVYVYWLASNGLYIYAQDQARIALAGQANNANIDILGDSRFEGRYLHIDNVYARTRDWSHANMVPVKKLFATSLGHSSIYFFGAPDVVSPFSSPGSYVIPIWNDDSLPPKPSVHEYGGQPDSPPNPAAMPANKLNSSQPRGVITPQSAATQPALKQ
jgi:hypothetical protein